MKPHSVSFCLLIHIEHLVCSIRQHRVWSWKPVAFLTANQLTWKKWPREIWNKNRFFARGGILNCSTELKITDFRCLQDFNSNTTQLTMSLIIYLCQENLVLNVCNICLHLCTQDIIFLWWNWILRSMTKIREIEFHDFFQYKHKVLETTKNLVKIRNR